MRTTTPGEVVSTVRAGELPGYQWRVIAPERQGRDQEIKGPVEADGARANRLREVERAAIV